MMLGLSLARAGWLAACASDSDARYQDARATLRAAERGAWYTAAAWADESIGAYLGECAAQRYEARR